MRKLGVLISALVVLIATSAHAITNVTIVGTIDNFYGNPCVYCHVDIYPLSPTLITGGNGTLVGNIPPVMVETDTSGNFSASVAGSVTAAVFVEETSALFKTTLPASGTVTLAQIQAAQPNVVSAFPPTGNLDMGGNRFVNMGGGQAAGDSVAVGKGLDSAQTFTANGNYIFPTGATYAEALLVGAGGSGGNGNSGGSNGGGGGGAGAIERCWFGAVNGVIALTMGGPGINTVAIQTAGSVNCTANSGSNGAAGTGGGPGAGGAGGTTTTPTGAVRLLYQQAGSAGANGSAGGGGLGAGAGQFGGTGGAPSSGVGLTGPNGYVVLWAY